MKARLLFYHKAWVQGRFVIEMTIHDVGRSKTYPQGIKYGLICKDITNEHFVLFDNHHPKGPHYHIGRQEFSYLFSNEDQLIEDFKQTVLHELGVKL